METIETESPKSDEDEMPEPAQAEIVAGEEELPPIPPPMPEPEKTSDEVPGIKIDALLERSSALETSLERLWKLDSRREERFEKLHGELETYRQGREDKATDPLLFSLIKLRDGFSKRLRAWRAKEQEEVSKDRLLRILDDCIDDVDLALEHHGVTAFEEPTDELLPKRQTVVRTVPCDDDRVGSLAERIGPGFEKGERLLIKERVMVYSRKSRPSQDGEKEQ